MNITDKVTKSLLENKAKNQTRLKKQQEYYNKMVKKGLAKKREYNLKTLAVI